jgi:hypothetical protein
MPIMITMTEWEIPGGKDCQFASGHPCPFLGNYEYNGSAFCRIERSSSLEPTKRQTWEKTPACKARG